MFTNEWELDRDPRYIPLRVDWGEGKLGEIPALSGKYDSCVCPCGKLSWVCGKPVENLWEMWGKFLPLITIVKFANLRFPCKYFLI